MVFQRKEPLFRSFGTPRSIAVERTIDYRSLTDSSDDPLYWGGDCSNVGGWVQYPPDSGLVTRHVTPGSWPCLCPAVARPLYRPFSLPSRW